MRELYYSPLDLAVILNSMELGAKEESELLDRIWEHERAFIDPQYRKERRSFILKISYWSHYICDKISIDAEFPSVQKDLWQSQSHLSENEYTSDHLGLELFFKSVRIRMLRNGQRRYVRIKLRSLLKQYGYQRRSAQLVKHIDLCLIFYHLKPYLRGSEECEIGDINIDDMVIFREIE